ncbi:hypothetical protein TRFO_12107 [Tritrichomonas foetus]|uniref:ubiquitinyl hydrolase 1 n=1 Tax=Tritrichomonas foetus TaxID=1144522 RepID=A0A1J4J606_9EUKA|nr:hypothetical protein TRFO_12107 [Tritrichomonas foetus]|eukprot:OHS93083.1 hypothetical protein TRFO_12107 [Tritrichomonas foetus]
MFSLRNRRFHSNPALLYAEKIKIPEKSRNPVLHKENSRVEVNPNSKESINTWETNANTTEVSTNITEVNTSTAEVNTNITEVNANTAEVSTSTILTEANTSMAKDINTEESIKKLTYNNTENESSKDPLFEIINENNKNAENNNNINENTLESKGVTNFILDNPNKSTNNAESTVNESNTNKFENDNKTITNNISLNSKNQINDEDNYSEEKPKIQIKSLNISKDLNFANLSDQIVSAYITAEGYHDPNFSSEYLVMHHVDSNPLVNEINRDIKLTLNECLNLFSVNEKLDENNQWFCPHCRKFVCADKKMDIWSVPKCLIIHLKRFITTQHSTYSSKVSTSILYDQILDMSNYVIGPQDKNSMKYQLKAVSEHMGSTYAGHYTAMALVDENFSFHQQYTYSKIQQRSNKKKWYSFNDSNVREIEDVKSVQSEDAYVLFYERIDDQQNEEEEEEETETEEKITGKSHEFTTGKSPTIHFPHPFTDSHEESSEKDTVKEEEDTNENKSDNNEKDDQQSEVYKYSHRMKLMPSQKITMNEFLQKEKLKSVLDSLEEEEEYDEDMFKRRSFNF